MNFTIKPNFKEVGSKLGAKMSSFQLALQNLTEEQKQDLQNEKEIIIQLEDEPLKVTKKMIEIRIEAKSGYNVGMEKNDFIILNTERSDELILEGLARELISKVQQLRKNKEYVVTDRIHIYYEGTEKIELAIEKFEEYIKEETLALKMEPKSDLRETFDLNGEITKISIEKATESIE